MTLQSLGSGIGFQVFIREAFVISKTGFSSLVFVTLFTFQGHAEAEGDVYNFYFQKAPGPQTVIQGGAAPAVPSVESKGPETTPTSPPPNPGLVQSTTAALGERVPDSKIEKKWILRLARTYHNDSFSEGSGDDRVFVDRIGEGTGLYLGYSLNRFVAFEAGLDSSHFLVETSSAHDTQRSESQSTILFPSLSVVLTPVRMNVFGYDLLEYSAIAGVSRSIDGASNSYFGLRMGLNLTSDLALESRWLNASGAGINEAQLGLAWKF